METLLKIIKLGQVFVILFYDYTYNLYTYAYHNMVLQYLI